MDVAYKVEHKSLNPRAITTCLYKYTQDGCCHFVHMCAKICNCKPVSSSCLTLKFLDQVAWHGIRYVLQNKNQPVLVPLAMVPCNVLSRASNKW